MDFLRKIIPALVILCLPLPASAENFRGKLAAEITSAEEQTIQFTVDSLTAVRVGEGIGSSDLLQGIEINLTIPPALRRYRDGFILLLFKNISPPPSDAVTSYYGERFMEHILPPVSKFYIRIPVSADHTLKAAQGTYVVDTVCGPEDFPVMLSVLPVMKGIPPEVYSSKLEMSVKPLYFSKGKLLLTLSDKDTGEDIDGTSGTITVDGTVLPDISTPIPLKTGIHTLTVDIPGYSKEKTSFSLEQGRTSTIALEISRTTPTFSIEAPREASIFINGTLYDGIHGRIEEITPGSHTILFKIGDYSISKKIEIKEGKNYNISLFFDIFIEED
jgi:hypothetical protein